LFIAQGAVKLGRGSRLMLGVRHGYRLQELPERPNGWHVVTEGYAYRLIHRNGQPIISYHWHPIGDSPVTHPHLHVSGRAGTLDLSKAHLPTGHVAVVRMTITELGVEPLRDDWDTVLDQAERDLARQ